MGSGEADVKAVLINTNSTAETTKPFTQTVDFKNWNDFNNPSYNYLSTWPQTIYMYQIKCPRCKKFNWAQLEVITPCIKCQARLKAVADVPDYTVPVQK